MSENSGVITNFIRKTFNGKGTLNKSAFPNDFVHIVKMTQNELKNYVEKRLASYYDEVISGDGYVYAKGKYPVVLTAHMDTVHKYPVLQYWGNVNDKGQHIISSPEGIGGDDRCGIFMILEILRTTSFRPTIIFCEDEEIGGIGSEKFIQEKFELGDIKFFIELDRANANDLVFYDDENFDFMEWCEKVTGYKTDWGSFSDISNFCPAYGISGVNVSCGYYNAHTLDEYVVLEEMLASIEVTKKLLEKAKEIEKPFEYKETTKTYNYYNSIKDWYCEDDEMVAVSFVYYRNHVECMDTITGVSLNEAIGKFLVSNSDLSWNEVLDYEVWK